MRIAYASDLSPLNQENADLVVLIPVAIVLGAYLVGSFPTAYVMVRLATGDDIRLLGTKNVGTLNTFQQAGIWPAVPVFLVDVGKGVLAVSVPTWIDAPQWMMFLTAVFVVLGHNWSVFLKFQGGKGAAAILGISLMLAPTLTLVTLGPVLLVSILIRNIVLGVAFGFILWNIMWVLSGQSPERISLCVLLTSVVVITYIVSIREHVLQSIKGRRWKELFIGLR